MNADKHPNPPVVSTALYGIPGQPNACPCGCNGAFVDMQSLSGRRGRFFVLCPCCGRCGPYRRNFNDALAVWNRITWRGEYSLFRVVDNSTT